MLNRLKKLLAPAEIANKEGPQGFNLRFLWFSLLVGTVSMLTGLVWVLLVEPRHVIQKNFALMIPLFFLVTLSFYLVYRVKVRLASQLLSWGIFIIFLIGAIQRGGVVSSSFTGLIAVVLFSGMLLGYPAGRLFAFLGFAAGLCIILTNNFGLTVDPDLQEPGYTYFLMQVALSFLAVLILFMVERRWKGLVHTIEEQTVQLKESQERYRQFYKEGPVGIFRASPTGELLEINQQAASILGLIDIDNDEFYSVETFFDLDPKHDELWQQLIHNGFLLSTEVKAWREDGTSIWVVLSAREFVDEQDDIHYFECSIEDITVQKEAEDRIRYYSEFERMITSISTKFISLQGNEIEAEINKTLAELGTFLDVDRCELWRIQSDQQAELTHQWNKNGALSSIFLSDRPGGYQPVITHLRSDGVMAISSVASLSSNGKGIKQIYLDQDIKSVLNVPFGNQQARLGWIGLQMVKNEKVWPEEVVRILKVVGDIIANALQRRTVEEELQIRLDFETLVASLSARLVNAPREHFKEIVEDCLRQVASAIGADRSIVWGFSKQESIMSLKYEWVNEAAGEKLAVPLDVDLMAYPWLLDNLEKGEPVLIPVVRSMPVQASPIKDVYLSRGMNAILMLPVAPDGETVGSITFQYLQEQSGWSKATLGLLKILAEVILNAIERVTIETALIESEERYRLLVETSPDAVMLADLDGNVMFCNPQFVEMHGFDEAGEVIGSSVMDLVAPEDCLKVEKLFAEAHADEKPTSAMEFGMLRKDGTRFIGEVRLARVSNTDGQITGTIGIGRDITGHKRAENDLHSSEMRFQTFMNTLPALAFYKDEEGKYLFANHAYEQIYGFSESDWQHKTDEELWPNRAEAIMEYDRKILETGAAEVFEGSSKFVGQDLIWQVHKFPFTDTEGKKFLGSIAIDITGQKQAEKKIAHQLQNMQALRTIDQAIAANSEMDTTLRIILEQAQTQLGIDAADILLYENPTQTLVFADSIGFQSGQVPRVFLRAGSGCAGRVIMDRRTLFIPNIAEGDECVEYIPKSWANEGFVSYVGVPLVAKGVVAGVLELFHRSILEPDEDWCDFLEMLGGQAAIAIENATLFKELQCSNMEMSLAYDTTLEGWARALELRDQETEGHSRRVTDLTLLLAREMGINQEDLVHVRRGALLHDIGKMGVPDSILHKPGPLNDEEWEIMRQHPVMAYRLLTAIPYLRRAMEIPYSHHERWDGSGYPQGLQGEEIPLSARIFSVIDVWDALLSDRPYRDAWPEEKVLAYLKEQSGKQFDPRVVDVFFQIVEAEKQAAHHLAT